MGTNEIKISPHEKDLGVIVDKSGKASEQCILAVKKANGILGFGNTLTGATLTDKF